MTIGKNRVPGIRTIRYAKDGEVFLEMLGFWQASLPPAGKTWCFLSFTRSSTLLALGIAGGSWWCEANRGK
jgi:hypothetical protein